MDVNIKLSDYINDEEHKLKELEEKVDKLQSRFKRRGIIFAACFIIIIVASIILTPVLEKNEYYSYKSVKDTDRNALSEMAEDRRMVAYHDFFQKYEYACLGNTCNNQINSGLVVDNMYGNSIMKDDGSAVISTKKGGVVLEPAKASCINLTENNIFYRDATNNLYYSCDLHGKNHKKIIKDRCGQCAIIEDKYIYYINFNQGSEIYRCKLNGKSKECIVNESVKEFTVFGNRLIYLDFANCIKVCDGEGYYSYSINNVDKFYFNGDIVAQCNDVVTINDINDAETTEVLTGIDDLLGATSNAIYYSNNGKAYRYDIKDKSKEQLATGHDYYKGAFETVEDEIVIGGDLSEDK